MQATVLELKNYRATQQIEDGKELIFKGDLDEAINYFRKSIENNPTAEGYTYLAWVKNLKGETDEAIELCKKAIILDSSLGNPFNDIGSYLIQKNRLEDAIPWLQEAATKTNYEPRHFPHINLGRIYAAQGEIEKAIYAFKAALEYSPDHPEIEKVLGELENIKSSTN